MEILYLAHHGILGQKWGVRRFQNEDGSLTEAGRKRYGNINSYRYEKDSPSDDYVIKKGTRATRVISIDDPYEYYDPDGRYDDLGRTIEEARKIAQDRSKEAEAKHQTKYMSVDNYLNRGFNGTNFYVNWFSDGGWDINRVSVDEYVAKNDIKVANGKKVFDTLLSEYGNHSVNYNDVSSKLPVAANKKELERYVNNYNKGVKALQAEAMKTAMKHDVIDTLVQKLAKEGYQAMEDIHDDRTSFPIIVFDASKSFTKTGSVSGEDYVRAIGKDGRNNFGK